MLPKSSQNCLQQASWVVDCALNTSTDPTPQHANNSHVSTKDVLLYLARPSFRAINPNESYKTSSHIPPPPGARTPIISNTTSTAQNTKQAQADQNNIPRTTLPAPCNTSAPEVDYPPRKSRITAPAKSSKGRFPRSALHESPKIHGSWLNYHAAHCSVNNTSDPWPCDRDGRWST